MWGSPPTLGGNPPTREGRPAGRLKKGGIKGEKGGFAYPAPGVFSSCARFFADLYRWKADPLFRAAAVVTLEQDVAGPCDGCDEDGGGLIRSGFVSPSRVAAR